MLLWIKKNGTTYAGFEHVHASSGTSVYPTVFGSALMDVVSGDIITTETYHNYGSSINVTDGSGGTWPNASWDDTSCEGGDRAILCTHR